MNDLIFGWSLVPTKVVFKESYIHTYIFPSLLVTLSSFTTLFSLKRNSLVGLVENIIKCHVSELNWRYTILNTKSFPGLDLWSSQIATLCILYKSMIHINKATIRACISLIQSRVSPSPHFFLISGRMRKRRNFVENKEKQSESKSNCGAGVISGN